MTSATWPCAWPTWTAATAALTRRSGRWPAGWRTRPANDPGRGFLLRSGPPAERLERGRRERHGIPSSRQGTAEGRRDERASRSGPFRPARLTARGQGNGFMEHRTNFARLTLLVL